jgi:hypothetical protein
LIDGGHPQGAGPCGTPPKDDPKEGGQDLLRNGRRKNIVLYRFAKGGDAEKVGTRFIGKIVPGSIAKKN